MVDYFGEAIIYEHQCSILISYKSNITVLFNHIIRWIDYDFTVYVINVVQILQDSRKPLGSESCIIYSVTR